MILHEILCVLKYNFSCMIKFSSCSKSISQNVRFSARQATINSPYCGAERPNPDSGYNTAHPRRTNFRPTNGPRSVEGMGDQLFFPLCFI